ncbi:MAG: phosphonate ABC transporter substrate-binding protein [Clostridiales bacterium]|nr:MAG: phosphonate ABC transporter substrate-binding protein [Clostridiales bacterium]
MKKLLLFLLIALLVFPVVSCSNKAKEEPVKEGEVIGSADTPTEMEVEEGKTIEELIVYFVPSREPDEIVTATEPLKELLKAELMKSGYDIKNVKIEVGTTYEAVGEALDAGSAQVGFVPGGTYVLYEDGVEVILTATRAGLNKDSEVAKDWNDGKPTEPVEDQVTYYKGLLVAGPSEKGQALVAKVNNGEELTADDLKDLNWGVRSTTSSSGYIYPMIYLKEKYGLSFNDMPNVVQTDSYGSSMAKLASGQIDVATVYADARRDYADKWTSEFSRKGSIWEETGVIGVTSNIYNDTISVSKSSPDVDDAFKAALQDAFINIAKTPEGKEVIKIYAHEGYQKAEASDYEKEREAQKILKELSE